MNDTIIDAENISKRYRLGLQEKATDTLAGELLNTLTAPLKNFKRLSNLSKFGDQDESVFWALKDISFEVKRGEVLGVIGKNGAGKSTLLKILSRITDPTTGSIKIHGRVASLLEVGTGFHPELTGRENIYMNGTILGMRRKEIDKKFDEIVDFSGVEKFIDTPVKFYSSGMKVRLGFAVAAHLEPEILIVDEVLAVGDAEFQSKCIGKMQDVTQHDGRTVLFVSHNMAAVEILCTRAILLNMGQIEGIGDTDKMIKNYLNNQIEAFKPKSESIKKNFFNSIVLVNKDLINTDTFSHSEKIGIDIELEIHEWHDDLELALSVKNASHARLFTKNIPLAEFMKKSGKLSIRVYFKENYLMAGQYSWMIYINKPRVVAFDQQESILRFKVIDTGSQFSKYGVKMGEVFPPQCEITRI